MIWCHNLNLEGNQCITTLVDLLRYRSGQQPSKIAFTFLKDGETESDNLTYQELDRNARAIAAQLQSLVVPGSKALLLYPSGLEFIAAFFGCLYAGVVAVPAYPPRRNQKMSRLQAIVADAQITVALTTKELLVNIESRFAETPELPRLCWLATDNIGSEKVVAWQEALVSSETLAFLQYTSGSTGTPKGVMVSHGNLLHNSEYIKQAFELTPDSVSVSWLPSFHDMGLIDGIIQPVYTGFLGVLMASASFVQRPIRWLQAISRYRATHCGGPNFGYELCVSNITPEQRDTLDLSSWCSAYSGAEPIRKETLERFAAAFKSCGFQARSFYPCYGMAETTLMVSGGYVKDEPVYYTVAADGLEQNRVVKASSDTHNVRHLVGCGHSWLDTKIVIADPELLTQCAPDQVGEIWVSGSSVAQGYWNRPEQTEQIFRAQLRDTDSGPFLRTGDLGFKQGDELFITGRLKDLIIIRGRNHYPQDIELTVEQCHPALRPNCGAAFSVELNGQENLVIAQEVERTYLRKLNANEVIETICRVVAQEYDIEVYAVLLLKTASIPKTSSGKIQRSACRAGFLNGSLDVVADWSVKPEHKRQFQRLGSDVESLLQHIKTSQQLGNSSKIDQFNTLANIQQKSQSVEAIASWLISKVAEQLQVLQEKIDIRQPFVNYGLSSLAAVRLSGKLQEWLGRQLSPTLFYDYPTIEVLAQHLAGETTVTPNTPSPAHLKVDIDPTAGTETDDIAIIGMSCRFPGAKNPESFWHLLRNGIDAIEEVPPSRWNVNAFYDPLSANPNKMNTRWGGFLEQVDRFDPHFFGISPREAESMDPQQRLLLEVSWEALENAGQIPEQLSGSQTGVFIGISNYDYSRLQVNHPTGTDAYSGTGSAFSIAANRISYILNLRGPSWAVDTACSSSLVAVHQACQSLHSGECQLALVGGVNLILTPQLTIAFSQAQMMSANGRCKTFDASADGYVRGEGCGVVVLKRLRDAQRDGDNILAVIKGSAVNQDGRSNGLTAPNGLSQQQVICQALKNAGVKPAQISYVEAHGTGTSLGDPIEVNSLKEVLMQGRDASEPCWIGSVKTNIGHLEAAAGITGLIKVVLSLQHGEIPPHLHLMQLNPHIDLEDTPLSIPTKRQIWSGGKQRRLAGVSSFGFGGTNAHVVLEEASPESQKKEVIERPLHLLTLSAKNENALRELARDYQAFLADNSEVSIADICFTANTGRSHFEQRLAIVTESTVQLREQLGAFVAVEETAELVSGQLRGFGRPKIAFLFTGQGSQYVDMGRQLYETQAIFRQTLDRCDEILRPYLEKPLLKVLYPEPEIDSPLNDTAYTQPALFALEYALFQLWKSWGIEPAVVMGHSVGEYVAACVAGVFSLEDGLKLIASRGHLMQALPQDGKMVAVLANVSQVQAAIKPYAQKVSLAAINGPKSVVISGQCQAIEDVCTVLEALGLKTKPLQVSHAFHSPLMEPMMEKFAQITKTVTYSTPQISIISNVTGDLVSDEIATSEYWVNHLRQPVRFAEGITTLHQQEVEVFVECGPKPTLLGMGCSCLPKGVGVWLPSLRPSRSDWQQLLSSLGELYVRGVAVDWTGFDWDYPRRKVGLPTYPFQRQRYWIEMAESAYQTPESTSKQQPQTTPIMNLLSLGETDQLAQLLGKTGKFSLDEMKFLSKFVDVLVQQQQQQVATASLQESFYKVEWRQKLRFGSQLLSPNYLPTLEEISVNFRRQLAELIAQSDLKVYGEALTQMEALSIAYVLNAFKTMGWEFQQGRRFSTAFMAEQLGVVNQHRRLLGRLLEMLAEVGILQPNDSQWDVIRVPQRINSQEQLSLLAAKYSSAKAELSLLGRCGSSLASVLRGECDPRQLLFPEGDLTTASQIYQDSPGAQVMNTLVQKVVSSVLEHLPSGHGVRVLEIGAGTGGTTSYILPILPIHQTEYVFTDLSPKFAIQAQEKFRDYTFVRYDVLDIEQDPELQGFQSHQYDIIVAANVLHATKDLRQTMQHIQQLLVPNGMLVLLEGTARKRWIDLIFGLTEGWWRFTDLDLRSSYPLLAANQWQELLQESGFKGAVVISPEKESEEALSHQAVIVAQAAQVKATPEPRSWLIFADERGMSQELIAQMRSKGEACTLIFPGKQYEQLTEQEFRIDPASPGDFQQLMEAVRNHPPLRGVIHCWSLDAKEAEVLTGEDLEAFSLEACGSILHLVQSLVKSEFSELPSLWLVTRGAVPVEVEPNLSGLAQSPLWGMGKVISLEHPELWGGMLDLDPDATNDEAAKRLLTEIYDSEGEDHIAFRHGQRYVARLVHSSQTELQGLQFQSDNIYLIIGGLGFLGLRLARWMIEQGARHLVITGRRTIPKRDDWASLPKNTDTWKQVQAIQSLEEMEATVLLLQADVSDRSQMSWVFDQINTAELPLKGIIHAAGVGGYEVIQDMKLSAVESMLRPKTVGAWLLHQLTKDLEIDFFVCFSSAGSVWGAKGQGHYDAANHFLDVLAHYRRSIGLPALSVNWGLLAGGGMVTREYHQWLQQIGIKELQPEQGFDALGHLLSIGEVQTTVANVNWSQFKNVYEVRGKRLLLEEILVQPSEKTDEQQSVQRPDILQKWEEATAGDRHSLIIDYVQTLVTKVLRLSPSQLDVQQPLNSMGLDSLMAVDLRNRVKTELEVDVPMVKFMEGFSVASLATLLSKQLTDVRSPFNASLNTPPRLSFDVSKEVHPENGERLSQKVTFHSDWIEGKV